MPMASISNGHLGPLRPAKQSEVAEYLGLVATGAGLPPEALPSFEAARATAGQLLHVCEFWMPGGCNLRCKHCYVASPGDVRPLSADDFAAITTRLVGAGLVDGTEAHIFTGCRHLLPAFNTIRRLLQDVPVVGTYQGIGSPGEAKDRLAQPLTVPQSRS